MSALRVAIHRLAADLPLPRYETAQASGLDLLAAVEQDVTLAPGQYRAIPCGISLALPEGLEAQVRPRSGLAAKHGVTVLNAPGTIDADYRGEIKALLINHGVAPFVVSRLMRIAQLVFARVEQIQWCESETLPASERGDGGFGSTGSC